MYYTKLYYASIHHTIPYNIVLYCTVLYCTILYYTIDVYSNCIQFEIKLDKPIDTTAIVSRYPCLIRLAFYNFLYCFSNLRNAELDNVRSAAKGQN